MIQYEKKKSGWVDGLSYATHYENFVAAARSIKREDEKVTFILFDRQGECRARMDVAMADGFSEGIYVFCMGVTLEKGEKVCIIRSFRPAIAGEDAFSPMDCYGGLSPDKVAQYKKQIKANIGFVLKLEEEHPENAAGYGKLLMAYFTQSEADCLTLRPASISDDRWQMNCGRYVGGALATVANVSTMCINIRMTAELLSNGLYDSATDYPLMVTAGLLCMAGMGEYVGDDMNKTQKGVIRGYHSLVQSRIEPLIYETGMSLMDGDKLLNTLQCMFPGSGNIKSVTSESSVCRAILELYNEMDSCDEYLSEAPSEEEARNGFRYSKTLGRFFVFPKKGDSETSDQKAGVN